MSCPSINAAQADEDCFFCPEGIHWDAHRIGWAVAGSCAAVTALITFFTVTMHATHYQQPAAQRQVMRVLLMPPVYAIVSFFSYRYYREYEYYILAETAYEAITLSAFLMLLMELVAMSTADKNIMGVLKEKDKRKLPFPFGFWRFRASKPYFMHTLSFSVMQYVVIRPVISIVGIICEYFEVLCPQKYSVHFAEVYLEAVDFISISFALYGLIVFYVLCKDELKGRRPLNKFLAIKLIVFFTFYQSFVFSVLQNYNVIKATAYWTANNVSDGLSALCTTVEMVIFSIYMGWAYSWTEYTNREINPHQRKTGIKTYFQAIWDTINLTDFVIEIWRALKFFVNYLRGVPGTHSAPTKMQQTFMPHTINPQEKLPMTTMDQDLQTQSGVAPQARRTSSGNLIQGRSPSYQRLNDYNYNQNQEQSYQQGYQEYSVPMSETAATQNPHYQSSTPAFPSPHPTGFVDPNQPDSAGTVISPQSGYTTSSSPYQQTSPTQRYHHSQSQSQNAQLSPPAFPSPRPTGPHPAPVSARSVQTYNTAESGTSHYATPMNWDENQQPSWPNPHPDYTGANQTSGVIGRPGSTAGIPGNPRLF